MQNIKKAGTLEIKYMQAHGNEQVFAMRLHSWVVYFHSPLPSALL